MYWALLYDFWRGSLRGYYSGFLINLLVAIYLKGNLKIDTQSYDKTSLLYKGIVFLAF